MKGLKLFLQIVIYVVVVVVFFGSIGGFGYYKAKFGNVAADHVPYESWEIGERASLGDMLDDVKLRAPAYYPEAHLYYRRMCWSGILCIATGVLGGAVVGYIENRPKAKKKTKALKYA